MTTTWKDNSIMYWHDGVKYCQVSDHNRAPLNVETERIESSGRMVDGTMRRYSVAKKRTWTISWERLPSRRFNGALNTADGGMCGTELEDFYLEHDGAFAVKIMDGRAGEELTQAMITAFSKEVTKRSELNDLWTVNITLVEV